MLELWLLNTAVASAASANYDVSRFAAANVDFRCKPFQASILLRQSIGDHMVAKLGAQ